MVAVEMAFIILIQVAMPRKWVGFWTWMLIEVWAEAELYIKRAILPDAPVWALSPQSLARKRLPEKIDLKKVYPN